MFVRWTRERIEELLRLRGYELKKIDGPLRGFEKSLQLAVSRGLSPRTVLDVGVGPGTPWLYDAFPEAKLVLFEPLSMFESSLRALETQHDADVHRVALSDGAGEAELNVNAEFPTSSSFLEADPDFDWSRNHRFVRQRVKVDTLDRLNTYEAPFVLKLDVEGWETKALSGAGRTLERTELIIIEISVMRRVQGEPSFATTIRFLDERGFELFDIPSLTQAKDNGPLVFLDAVFVQKDSPLWSRRSAHNAGY